MYYALITGASKGIGKCIAEELAAKGFNLLLTARSEDLLRDVSSDLSNKYKIETKYLAIDLTGTGAALKIYDWCTTNNYKVQALVNNAGYGLSGAFEKYAAQDHIDMMHVNMNVPVELCRLFLPGLKEHSKSYILNIGSSSAYQAVPGLTVYAASKAFVLSFSRGLRKELNNTAVTVTCICPGSTDTNFVNQAQIGEKARKLAEKVNMTPQKVASIAVAAMLKRKVEVIPGFINKAGAILTWLLPKSILENGAMKIYQP
jgi:short-subunit dehydrogenase